MSLMVVLEIMLVSLLLLVLFLPPGLAIVFVCRVGGWLLSRNKVKQKRRIAVSETHARCRLLFGKRNAWGKK